jgi:hypothetical protein
MWWKLDTIIRENGVSSGIDVISIEIYDEHRPVQETNAYIPLQVTNPVICTLMIQPQMR